MNNAAARNRTLITVGLDLGDRRHTYYVLDEAGKMAKEGSLANTREQLATMARSYPGATVVMEAGMHSPWVSRFLQELGLRVIVANPRKTRAIYENERKSDRRDAMMLARLARMDPTLLHPLEHGSQEAQQDMLQLKLRDSLVRARVALINAVRFTLKSLGYPVSNPSSASFHKLVLKEVPESHPLMTRLFDQKIPSLSVELLNSPQCWLLVSPQAFTTSSREGRIEPFFL